MLLFTLPLGLIRFLPVYLSLLDRLLIFVECEEIRRFSFAMGPFHPRFCKRCGNTQVSKRQPSLSKFRSIDNFAMANSHMLRSIVGTILNSDSASNLWICKRNRWHWDPISFQLHGRTSKIIIHAYSKIFDHLSVHRMRWNPLRIDVLWRNDSHLGIFNLSWSASIHDLVIFVVIHIVSSWLLYLLQRIF